MPDAAPSLKHKAALSVACGAGLRASEIISLKGEDIDSTRWSSGVEQDEGRNADVMLSPHLLELLRAWWQSARPRGCCFPARSRAAVDDAPAQPPATPRR